MNSRESRIHQAVTLDLDSDAMGRQPADTRDQLSSILPSPTIIRPQSDRLGENAGASGFHRQINRILRDRLIACSAVIGAVLAVFFVWDRLANPLEGLTDLAMQFALGVSAIAMFGIGASLRRKPNCSRRHLRFIEFIVFATPVIYCTGLIAELIPSEYQEDGVAILFRLGALWTFIIYTYGLFVPNDWRRAAKVLSIIGVVPIVATTAMLAQAGIPLTDVLSDLAFLTILVTTSVVTSSFAASKIHWLRRQVASAQSYGQYTLGERIGSGGMGEVFLAKHKMLRRPAAIKLIRAGDQATERLLDRFEMEVQATSQLSHWNVVEVYDYGRTNDGTFYYVMEYLPGLNLDQIVRRSGPMPVSRALHFAHAVCDALSEAHAANLVHRDIKPANIIAATRGGQQDVAKLLDFGLVHPTPHSTLSRHEEGWLMGSPAFMSPEQAMRTGKIDARSDIYSLGATIFWLVTGRPPMGKCDIDTQLNRLRTEDPPRLTEINPDLGYELSQLVANCLCRRPEDRYLTVEALQREISMHPQFGEWSRGDAEDYWLEQDDRRVYAVGDRDYHSNHVSGWPSIIR